VVENMVLRGTTPGGTWVEKAGFQNNTPGNFGPDEADENNTR